MIITHNGTILTNDGVVLNNIITSPSFINTYSLDFDGVDDYVNIGNGVSFEYTDSFSFSTWINPSAKSGVKYLYSKYISGKGILIYLNSSSTNGNNTLHFNLYNTNSGTLSGRKRITTSDFNFAPINTWVNIVLTYDGSGLASGINYYKNGVLRASSISQDNLQNQTIVNTEDAYLSSFNGVSSFLLGNQDEFAIYDSELSADDALAIYGTGQPTDLTNLNPIAWYRMGDNGTYKSPQWLIPNNENKDKVSNYSLDFDGVNDYIDLGDSDDFSFGNGTTDSPFSISIWVNFSSIGGSTFKGIIGKDNGAQREWALLDNNSGRLRIFLKNQGGGNQQSIDTTSVLSINTWYHIVATYNGVGGNNAADGLTLYLNGIEETPTNIIKNTYVAMSNTIAPLTIGKYSLNEFPGNIDATSIFNRELSISEVTSIYNGGGVATPGDLTPLNPIAWWKMGEDSTFSGGVWTVPDEVGSNDGTSVNMTIEDRVGTAPNSKNNALSLNMDLIDRVEDTPTP